MTPNDQTKSMDHKYRWYKRIAFALLFSGLLVLGIFIYFLSKNYSVNGNIMPTVTGITGDFIGGVVGTLWALAGVVLFYIALMYQRESFAIQSHELAETKEQFISQNKTLQLQRFENTFFQMLELHHEIIDKLEFVAPHFTETGTGNPLSGTREDYRFYKRAVLKKAGDQLITSMRNKNYSAEKNSKTKESEWEHILYANKRFFYSMRFKNVLSHYFRNVYHIFKLIYLSDQLESLNERKFYASLMRSQLSPDELLLLFYNSMSQDRGNPKFLFLMKEFDILKNFDFIPIENFSHHKAIYEDLLKKVENPFQGINKKAIAPSFGS